MTNSNEYVNSAVVTSGVDKTHGSTHSSSLALIQIPRGTLMCEGGNTHAYETAMRVSKPYSMVTAAQRTAAQAVGAVQDENRAKYQVKVQGVRPPRSCMNMNTGEGRPVLQQVRYAGNQPTRQQVEAVQKRRQQAAVNGADWQLCAKGAKENTDRRDRKDTEERGKKQPLSLIHI